MYTILLQAGMPVPKDIPLPLPLPEWLLVTLLIVSFLLHIVFVNLMVGGSMVALWAQIKGLRNNKYDVFAHEIAKTITVNKSMAVVLGVAPLLTINTLYTVYFYSANALTGFAWIMIIPLVIVAFLLTYLHKYTWDKLEQSKAVHIFILALATAVFLFIPLVFLVNVTLMMFPEKWPEIKGFVSALSLPGVFPRYIEFIGACLAVTGLFIVWYNQRRNYPVETIYSDFSRYELKKTGYTITVTGLAIQVLAGMLIVFMLPAKGFGYEVAAFMMLAGLLLIASLWFSYRSMLALPHHKDRYFGRILALMVTFMLVYGGSRQAYRHNSLWQHQKLVAARTDLFLRNSREAARSRNLAAAEPSATAAAGLPGKTVFHANCSACHQEKDKLVGPPVTEMASIYSSNINGLKNWIRKPGKKREGYPRMPGFSSLSERELNDLANYILSVK